MDDKKLPISRCREATEKGKLIERSGRKVTGLQPAGQGSGTAEVDRSFGELGWPDRRAGSVSPGPREGKTGGPGVGKAP